jgi:ectoine hydroxylase-related dioxygenase (phytanoyl-CoA dioxygenase family)
MEAATRITLRGEGEFRVLTEEQVEAYERDGFIILERLIDKAWIRRLQEVMGEFIEQSRSLEESTPLFDLEFDHSKEQPRLRRLVSPADLHPTFWEFVSESVLVDVVEDLIGPDIKFHHSKLNFKAAKGGEEVRWHQDVQFWPHTNYSPLTLAVFLNDVDENMGNILFVPGSHRGELFDQYDGDRWTGCLSDQDIRRAGVDRAVSPTGPAGTVSVHNCRTLHSSAPNHSDQERPLLLQTYAAADAFTYTDILSSSPHGNTLIRGEPARWARHDPRPCQVGPSRARTIFEVQQQERSD